MNAPSNPPAPAMRPRIDLPRVYLCRRPVDFRKGMRALAVLVEQELGLEPFAETVYVFANRRRTAVKCLAWERNGFCLWLKRLEAERFKTKPDAGDEAIELTVDELNWLLDGIDLWRNRPHQILTPRFVT